MATDLIDGRTPLEVLNLQKKHLNILQKVPPGKPLLIKAIEGSTPEGQDPDLYGWRDFTNIWHKVLEYGKPIYTRGILRNEIVFDPDVNDWETMKEQVGKLTSYLDLQGIPYELAYSGGKACHLHIFFDTFDLDTEDFKEAKVYDVDLWKCARETIVNELLKLSGADHKKMGLDWGKIRFDISKDSNGKNRMGSQIREYGTTRPNGKYKTLVDEIPETNPDYLPLRFPGQPKLWNISGTIFHQAVREAFKAEVDRARVRNEYNLDGVTFEDTEIGQFPCYQKIKALHLKNGRYYAVAGLGLLSKMCGDSREETGQILTDVLNTFEGLSPSDKQLRLDNSLKMYDTDKHFSCRKLKEMVGPHVCDFTRCPLKDKLNKPKEVNLEDIESPEVKEVLEKSRKAKEQFMQYKDLSPLEREIACNEVWRSQDLDMRKAGKAYKEVFPDNKKEEENDILEPVPAHIKERAREIAEKENTLEYILKAHQCLHVGDIGYATTLLLSCTNQSSLNSEGLQPKGSGSSGKGKSHCTKAMAHLIPRDWILTASLSNKAIYYMEGRIKPGMVLYCDDVTLSEEMEGVIKRSTTFYQTGDTYITMDKNRETMALTIPARLVWWLNSVDDEQSLQLLNRTFGAEVDESAEQDDAVALRELELAEAGTAGMPETDDILICREIIRDIKENKYIVKIPYARNIVWKDKANRRNLPIFLDLVRAFAILRHRQRDRDQDGALMADMQDFVDAKILYTSRQEAQGTKLTASERKLCGFLRKNANEMSYHLLADVMKVGESRITQILMGRKDIPDSGLIYKVPGLHVEKRTEKNDSGGYTSKNYVRLTAGYDPLAGFEEVVSIDINSDTYSIYNKLTPNLQLKNRNGKQELTLLTINNTQECNSISQSSCHEESENKYILLQTVQNHCKNCKNLTADNENTPVSSRKATVSYCKEPSAPLQDSVRKYCRDWEPVKKTSINSQNYKEVVTDYLKGYKLSDDMRGPVEAAVMIYAKIPQPPEVTQ
ncbi:MAG: hypothetical protein WBL02_07435 [Methanomethylovorans sp.]|uniref:hypothetical protein n=1 Tax=Methanomethylovorans sp. TaxID=2758717 RepID=UPI003C77F34B